MKWQLKLRVLLSIGRRGAETKGTAGPVTLKSFILQYIFGFNRTCWWPVHHSSVITGAEYIETGIGTAPGLSNGCYIFAAKDAPLLIGDYVLIAPNVGIAGYNHDIYSHNKFVSNGVTEIGAYTWIGMNSVILPGVKLGKHTVVAAGSIVTKSFPEGYVVIGGNPAVVIKQLDPASCQNYIYERQYRGYLTDEEYRIMKNHSR